MNPEPLAQEAKALPFFHYNCSRETNGRYETGSWRDSNAGPLD